MEEENFGTEDIDYTEESEESLYDLESTQNTYHFDGLYKGCYIRLESSDMSELLNALNLLYR